MENGGQKEEEGWGGRGGGRGKRKEDEEAIKQMGNVRYVQETAKASLTLYTLIFSQGRRNPRGDRSRQRESKPGEAKEEADWERGSRRKSSP